MTALNVGSLSFDVELDAAGLRAGLRRAADDVRRWAADSRGAGDGLSASFSSAARSAVADLDRVDSGLRGTAAEVRRVADVADDAGDGLASSFQRSTRAAGDDLDRLESKSRRTFTGIGDHARTALVGAAGAFAAMGVSAAFSGLTQTVKESVLAASEQEQAFGAVDTVLGDLSESAKQWAAEQHNIGLSATDAATGVTSLVAGLTNQGMSTEEATAKAKELTTVAADMAAAYGGPVSNAVDAIVRAITANETDPLEKYAISFRQADIESKAAAMGLQTFSTSAIEVAKAEQKVAESRAKLDKLRADAATPAEKLAKAELALSDAEAKLADKQRGKADELSKASKAQAVYALMLEQTSKIQGQAVREANTFDGQLKRLQSQWKNTQVSLGQPIKDALIPWMQKLNAAMPQIEATVRAYIPKVSAWLAQVSETVQRSWPQMRATLERFAGTVRQNWPTMVALAKAVADTMATLAPVVKTVVDAFLSLPAPMQQAIIMTAFAGAAYQRFAAPIDLVAAGLRVLPGVAVPAGASVAASDTLAARAATGFATLAGALSNVMLLYGIFQAGKSAFQMDKVGELAIAAGAQDGSLWDNIRITTGAGASNLLDNLTLGSTDFLGQYKYTANANQDAKRLAEYQRLKDSGQWRPEMAAELEAKYPTWDTTPGTININTMNVSANDPQAWQAEIDRLAASQALKGY